MSKVIVTGHGGYGTAMKRNLGMLVGEMAGFYFVDFNENDSLDDLQKKLGEVLGGLPGEDILFACDLTGGSPFRTAEGLPLPHGGHDVHGAPPVGGGGRGEHLGLLRDVLQPGAAPGGAGQAGLRRGQGDHYDVPRPGVGLGPERRARPVLECAGKNLQNAAYKGMIKKALEGRVALERR